MTVNAQKAAPEKRFPEIDSIETIEDVKQWMRAYRYESEQAYRGMWRDQNNVMKTELPALDSAISTAVDFDIPMVSGLNFIISGTEGISWSAGTVRYGGTDYTITAGDVDPCTSVFIDVTSLSDPVTLGTFNDDESPTINQWILANRDGEIVYSALQSPIINAGFLKANSVTAEEILVTSIPTASLDNTAGWTNDDTADGVQAILNAQSQSATATTGTKIKGGVIQTGSITADKININSSILVANTGNIRQGKTAYNNTTSGFYLGDSGDSTSVGLSTTVPDHTPIFHIGNATNYMYWNGSTLDIAVQTGSVGADANNVYNVAGKYMQFTGTYGISKITTDTVQVTDPGDAAYWARMSTGNFNCHASSSVNSTLSVTGLDIEAGLGTHIYYNASGMQNAALVNVNVSTNSKTTAGGIKYDSGALWVYNGSSWLEQHSGTILETQGGTGATAYTQGDILYSDTSNSLAKLDIGSTGQICSIVSGIPAWTASPTYTVTGVFGGSATSPEGDHVVDTGGTKIISFSIKTTSGTSAIARNGISVSGTNPYIWGQGGSTNAAIDSDEVSVSGGTLTFKAGNTGINSNGESFVYSVTFTK